MNLENKNKSFKSPKTASTIMMIDDDLDILKKFEEYFKSKGYNPISVSDPLTIIRHTKRIPPDLILMSINMKKLRGDDLIRSLRKIGIKIPIIVVSGYINKKLVVDLKSCNISAYFAKPVNFDKLEAKIHDLLLSKGTGQKMHTHPRLILLTENDRIINDPFTFIPRSIVEKHGLKILVKNSFQESVKLLNIPSNNVCYVVVDATREAWAQTMARLLKNVVINQKIPVFFIAAIFSEHMKNSLLKLGMDNIISLSNNFEKSFDGALDNFRNVSKSGKTKDRSSILNVLKSIKTMPPLPDIYIKIEKLNQNQWATIADFGKVLEFDPGITTRLLRMANSALFSFKRKIKSVKDAVSLMGTREIVSLVRIACITGNLKATPDIQGHVKEIWKHSANCAIVAKMIYEKTDICKTPNLADELFIAGIIHDIGKIVLLKYFKDIYLSFLNNPDVSSYPKVSEEKNFIGVSHTEVGMRIADHWKLPESLRDVVTYHHDPMVKPDSDLVMIIHISDIVTKLILKAIPEGQDPELNSEILEKIGYTVEQVLKLADDLGQEVKKLASQATTMISG